MDPHHFSTIKANIRMVWYNSYSLSTYNCRLVSLNGSGGGGCGGGSGGDSCGGGSGGGSCGGG